MLGPTCLRSTSPLRPVGGPLVVMVVEKTMLERTIVTFDVRDDHSPVLKVEYSADGEEWKAVFPTDGIADSRAEHFEVSVEGRIGARGLTLRALDSMNNVSTTQVDAPSAPAR